MRSTVQLAATFDSHDRETEDTVHEAARSARADLLEAGAEDVTVQIATTTKEPQQGLAGMLGQGPQQPQQKPAQPAQVEGGESTGGQYL